MRSVADMLESLARVLRTDADRGAHAAEVAAQAHEVAQRLPLVHRTCKPDAETPLSELLRTRVFSAGTPCTGARETAAGIPTAAYFFLGCGAYPDGLVGFVLERAAVLERPASYTPFDSGSLERHAVPTDAALHAAWDDASKARFLKDHLGLGAELDDFSGPYLGAHFRNPLDYVRSGQHSEPNFPTYHGLRSENLDRRAWTIEVQAHEDVPLNTPHLIEIVAARRALLEDLPDDLVGFARLALPENEVLESIAEGIVARIGEGAA